MGAVASSLHDVHAATVVRLLIQHPAVWRNKSKIMRFRYAVFSIIQRSHMYTAKFVHEEVSRCLKYF